MFQRQCDLKQQEEAGEPKTVNLSEVQWVNHEVPTKKQELRLKAAEDLKPEDRTTEEVWLYPLTKEQFLSPAHYGVELSLDTGVVRDISRLQLP